MWTIEAYDSKGARLPGMLATNCDVIAADMIQRLSAKAKVSVVVATYKSRANMPGSIIVLESGWFVHKDERLNGRINPS